MKNKLVKYLVILLSLVAIVVISILIFKKFENNDVTNNKPSAAEKFAKEYTNVSKNNVFVYSTGAEILKILENGTGVIYLGFPECQWCQSYVPILNETAKEAGIEKIHYFNILEDRKNNTAVYKKIVKLLNENLLYDDEGNRRVYVPDVTIVNKGTIVGHDNESSLVTESDGTPNEYWTKEKKEALKTRLTTYFNKISSGVCTSC